MEKAIIRMFKDAEKSHAKLKALKIAAVRCQDFEVAAGLRDLENKNFPDSDEAAKAKRDGTRLSSLFRLVELNISAEVSWLLNETIRKFRRRGDNFDMKDAAHLLAKKAEFFGED